MLKPIATVAVALLATAAPAQTTTAPAARGGGLGGLLGGGGLPNIAGVGAGNAAGLLGYCLKNNLFGAAGGAGGALGSLGALTGASPAPTPSATTTPNATTTGAQSILQRLTGRQGVANSPAYAAGQAGQVQAGNGQSFSLDSLRGQVKTRVCSVVLNRAKSFL